jgi:hypothetical protein
VYDLEKKVHHVWGDGKPEMTFTTEQYNAWRQEEMQKARGLVDR